MNSKEISGCRVWGEDKWKVTGVLRAFPLEMIKIFYNEIEPIAVYQGKCAKCHWILKLLILLCKYYFSLKHH
jgi:hypothetical protein